MKTISRYIMTLALLLTAVGGAWAQPWTSGDCTVTLSNGTLTVSGNGAMADYQAFYGQPWVDNMNDITSVVVESGVTTVGDRAFHNCENMTSVNLPEGLTTIGKITFQHCTKLTSVTIPSTVTSIGVDAFYGCTAMTDVYLYADPANLTWNDDGCDDFKQDGSTKCHVLAEHLSAYQTKFNGKVKVTVVGDLEPIEKDIDVTPAITVEWDAATKTGTFTMPANDVVLTPVYAEATILNDQTETSYASLKEAFAAVQDGDVIKLDWNVTLKEQLTTPERNGNPIHFMLDFNGYTITDGSGKGGYNCIELRNGDTMFLTDESKDKNGGLKGMVAGLQGSSIVFVGGRYDFGEGLTATYIKNMWVDHFALDLGWRIALGMEFIDLNNGSANDDGFFVCVAYKTFDLAIDSKRFATFYSDMNIKFAEQPAEGVGLYTISSIDTDHSMATVTPISGIIPAGTPMLVYNGTEQEQTAKLIVTLDNAQDAIVWAPEFMGTATDREFTADDMAAADYYALSGGKAFAPVKGAGTLGANQCWLQFDKNISNARAINLVFDETTGISLTPALSEGEGVFYDLNGRKIAAPTKKGIYILNGKKVVVK